MDKQGYGYGYENLYPNQSRTCEAGFEVLGHVSIRRPQLPCHFPSEFHYLILDGPAVHPTFTGIWRGTSHQASSILRRIEDIMLLSFTQPPSLSKFDYVPNGFDVCQLNPIFFWPVANPSYYRNVSRASRPCRMTTQWRLKSTTACWKTSTSARSNSPTSHPPFSTCATKSLRRLASLRAHFWCNDHGP